jgi:hypothetical protein
MPQIQIFGCRVACTSFVPETTSPKHNKHDRFPTKMRQNNEADRYPPAYSGLVAGSSAVRTNNEINSCSEACLRSQWALTPSIGEVPSSSERAACIAPNAEKFDNQNRGQLLSFLFAVAPNRTMGL